MNIYTYIVKLNNKIVTVQDARAANSGALLQDLRKIYPEPCNITIKPGFKSSIFAAAPRL